MRPDRFTGKVCVVTGAASGIGAAAAKGFAAEGGRVALLDLDEKNLAETAATIPGAKPFVVDVSSKASIEKAFEAVLKTYQSIHILVNSAGVIGKVTLQNMTEAEWDRVLDINLKGTALCTQAAIAPMRRQGGGAVVNVSSMAGKRVSFAGAANYTASKAGVVGFTWHAAFELGAYKIRVNAVCPGPTITGMTKNRTPEQLAATAKRIPLGRWVSAEDVANAILFLASEEAAMCTGTALDVDGGILVSNGSSYEEYFSSRT
ncbi:MAG TPA: SDR family NAD(P)-dependent oxidoreductase [Burkholderiales bacterium]|nr:SDR family NAD(P)-dependent oxidoreductase [Burkholderiales bacterium]